jgi:polyhydroxybutyrate depolymerase
MEQQHMTIELKKNCTFDIQTLIQASMKKLYNLPLALIVCLTFLSMHSFSQTTVIDSMPFGGVQRTYRLYIPAKYKSTTAVPLVLNLHGLGSNAMQQEAYGDFRPIADTADFILVHPNGTQTAAGQGWNNFGALGTGVDDVGFLSALIDKVSSKYSIDKNRIYSTGMSNGGFMSYDLACFLNTRIAAIASVTGSMIASHLKGCKANRPTPVMEIHGTADNTVSYDGKGGILVSTNIDTLVNFWAKFNTCSAPVVSTLPNINTTDGSTVEHQVYNNGKNGSTVELYKVIGGGHTWPGASVNIGVTNQDFSASKEIWRFFSQFRLDHVMSVDPLSTENMEISLFPNPSSNGFEIRTSQHVNYTVRIFNSMGQQMTEMKSENGSAHVSRDNLPAGIYVVQLSYTDHQVFKKVVLN